MMIARRLITIEGPDGAGKTTLAANLARRLSQRGIDARLMREPGGVQTSERIRDLVKDPALRVGARAEALLYAAARAQLVEESLRPALEAGRWVLLDRFVDSSLAYQGAARDLGVEAVSELNRFATGDLVPRLTLLLMLDADVALARTRERAQEPDRLEREGAEFFARIRTAYLELAADEPDRIKLLDASQPPETVADQAMAELEGVLEEPAFQ